MAIRGLARQCDTPPPRFHFALLQLLRGAKQQTHLVNQISEQPSMSVSLASCPMTPPHPYAYNWSGPEGSIKEKSFKKKKNPTSFEKECSGHICLRDPTHPGAGWYRADPARGGLSTGALPWGCGQLPPPQVQLGSSAGKMGDSSSGLIPAQGLPEWVSQPPGWTRALFFTLLYRRIGPLFLKRQNVNRPQARQSGP